MFQYPAGVVPAQTNLAQLYGLSSFWNKFYEDGTFFNDVLGAGTALMGYAYAELLQNMSPVSLELTNLYLRKEISFQQFPVGGPYIFEGTVSGCSYIVDRPVLPRVTLENGVDFTISNNAIVWANPERVSSYPFALQETSTGTMQSLWLVEALYDEGWLYNYYGNLLNVPLEPSSASYSQFLQGVLYLQVHGPNVDVLSAGLQITLGLPLALYDEVVLSTQVVEGQYVVITDQTSYSINANLGLGIPVGTQLSVGQPLFPQAGAVVDWQVQDKWWIDLTIPKEILPNPPELPVCTLGSWADQLMETYLKTHSFLVQLGVSVDQVQEFINILQDVIPTYTYPWVFSINALAETLDLTDTTILNLGLGWCQEFPQIDLFTRNNTNYLRGCPKLDRYSLPSSIASRNLGNSSLSQSFSGQVVFFPSAQFGLTGLQESYSDAVFGNRNMAMPRTRNSWTNSRGLPYQSQNPWPTLVPTCIVTEAYLSQYIPVPLEFFTSVPAGTVPFPSTYQYLGWKRENAQDNFKDIPAPSGSQQAIFQLDRGVYGICIIPAEDSLSGMVSSLKFGNVVDGLDRVTLSGTIPLTRGMAAVFNNPWFFGSATVGGYQDGLNAPMVIDRSGSTMLDSISR